MAELETTVDTEATENTETAENTTEVTISEVAESAEVARLKAELAKANNKNDVLAKENAAQKKELRSYKSAEQIRDEEQKAAEAEKDARLAELEKKIAMTETSKKVMSFIGDENTANTVAEYLYGAEDVDAALTAISKAWTAREKALRMEYGKIPAPGAGVSDGPTMTHDELKALSYKDRVEFANKHPYEYAKLMGR